jgi:hypothetical protein
MMPGMRPETEHDDPAHRKSERVARREMLYTVVREAMIRAGVLSSSYKFKVLSLDRRGTQFMAMIDLAGPQMHNATRLVEIEAVITETAKARHDIVVKAVYWRQNDQIAISVPIRPATGKQPSTNDVPPRPRRPLAPAAAAATTDVAPIVTREAVATSGVGTMASVATAAPTPPAARAAAAAAVKNPFDPIGVDEVAAFKQALAAGLEHRPSAKSQDGRKVHGPQSFTLLTGYEDTEQPDDSRPPVLSTSQYGDLR